MDADKQEGIGKGFLFVILFFSFCLTIFFGYNAYYYGQIVQPVDGTPAPITAAQSTTMMIINAFLCLLFFVIFFWGMGKLIYSNKEGATKLDSFKESFNKKLDDFGKKITSIGSGSGDKKGADGLTEKERAEAIKEKGQEIKRKNQMIEDAERNARIRVQNLLDREKHVKEANDIRAQIVSLNTELNGIKKEGDLQNEISEVIDDVEEIKKLKMEAEKCKRGNEPREKFIENKRGRDDKGGDGKGGDGKGGYESDPIDFNKLRENRDVLVQLEKVLPRNDPLLKLISPILPDIKGAVKTSNAKMAERVNKKIGELNKFGIMKNALRANNLKLILEP